MACATISDDWRQQRISELDRDILQATAQLRNVKALSDEEFNELIANLDRLEDERKRLTRHLQQRRR